VNNLDKGEKNMLVIIETRPNPILRRLLNEASARAAPLSSCVQVAVGTLAAVLDEGGTLEESIDDARLAAQATGDSELAALLREALERRASPTNRESA
jgi:hypothetical protein